MAQHLLAQNPVAIRAIFRAGLGIDTRHGRRYLVPPRYTPPSPGIPIQTRTDSNLREIIMGEGAADKNPASLASTPSVPQTPALQSTSSGDSLAAMLCPVLREVCGGRLSTVQWFRSAWQAGGAATGTATFQIDQPPQTVEVVVKLPVGPSEFRWTTSSSNHSSGGLNPPTPRVLAAGTELAGYDLAWLVVERLSGDPLSAHPCQSGVESLLHAAAEWYQQAESVKPIAEADPPRTEDWAALIAKGREAVRDNHLPDGQRWNDCLKHAQKALPRLVPAWNGREINTWCHGDLHPGNAMWRLPLPGGAEGKRCVLIDLALVHPGHWIEDALYLERLYWAKPDLLFGVKPVTQLARYRKELGLPTGDDYQYLANLRRVLMAATVPAFLEHEGHPRYVHSALGVLERTLPQL